MLRNSISTLVIILISSILVYGQAEFNIGISLGYSKPIERHSSGLLRPGISFCVDPNWTFRIKEDILGLQIGAHYFFEKINVDKENWPSFNLHYAGIRINPKINIINGKLSFLPGLYLRHLTNTSTMIDHRDALFFSRWDLGIDSRIEFYISKVKLMASSQFGFSNIEQELGRYSLTSSDNRPIKNFNLLIGLEININRKNRVINK